MKRRHFRAVVMSGQDIVGESDTFAWNSAIRASESVVREYARANGFMCDGGRPEVMDAESNGDAATGRIYRRLWTTPTGRELRAIVWEVTPAL